jgi:hypothetical protein
LKLIRVHLNIAPGRTEHARPFAEHERLLPSGPIGRD